MAKIDKEEKLILNGESSLGKILNSSGDTVLYVEFKHPYNGSIVKTECELIPFPLSKHILDIRVAMPTKVIDFYRRKGKRYKIEIQIFNITLDTRSEAFSDTFLNKTSLNSFIESAVYGKYIVDIEPNTNLPKSRLKLYKESIDTLCMYTTSEEYSVSDLNDLILPELLVFEELFPKITIKGY